MFAARWLQGWLSAGSQAIDALVFPWECSVCGAPAFGAPFCDPCRHELREAGGLACARCAMPIGPWADQRGGCSECRGRSLGFDEAVALGPYQGPIRELCLRLKHEHNAWLAPWLARVLVDARPALHDVPAGAWVIPVPLHWQRRWERGFNQADALAHGLAHCLGLRKVSALRRVVATPHLVGSGRVARAELIRHAFRARPRLDLKDRTVLLVDDILTSGATCGAAARVLKQAGAARVLAVVIGRAEGTPSR